MDAPTDESKAIMEYLKLKVPSGRVMWICHETTNSDATEFSQPNMPKQVSCTKLIKAFLTDFIW
jgi:hypothetical protein